MGYPLAQHVPLALYTYVPLGLPLWKSLPLRKPLRMHLALPLGPCACC